MPSPGCSWSIPRHLKAGLGTRVYFLEHGDYASLTDLQDGDLKMAVDFRRVYATVLTSWLGLPSEDALGGTFEPMPLFRS